jgi:hypothetical protein
MTRFTNYESTIGGKWLESLKEILPGLARVLVVLNPDNPGSLLSDVETTAPSLGIGLRHARPGRPPPGREERSRCCADA